MARPIQFPWTKQPQVALANTRFSNGLAALLNGSNPFVNLSNGLSTTSSTSVIRSAGPYGKFIGATNSGSECVTFSSDAIPTLIDSVSFFAVIRRTGNATVPSSRSFIGFGDAWLGTYQSIGLCLNASQQIQSTGSYGITVITGTPVLDTTSLYAIAYTNGPAGSFLYINGSLVASGARSTSATAMTRVGGLLAIPANTSSNDRGQPVEIYAAAGWNTPLSQEDARFLTANPWQLFAPLPRYIFAPAAAGGAFTPAITEAATATDTASAVTNYPAAITEAASAADTASAVTNFSVTITEAATAADTCTCVIGYACTATEAATATDTPSAVTAYAASITEAGSAVDTPNGSTTGAFTAVIAEAAAASDVQSQVAAFIASVTEAASAADSSEPLRSWLASLVEAASAADTVSASGVAGVFTAESRIRLGRTSAGVTLAGLGTDRSGAFSGRIG